MSKTKGNVIDPTELVEEYGADAAALHPGVARQPGPRHPAQPGPDRGLPRVRQQDLERHPLRALPGGGGAGAGGDRSRGARRARALDPLAPVAARPRRSTRSWRSSASTRPAAASTTSSGATSATGTSSCPSRRSSATRPGRAWARRAAHRARPQPAPPAPGHAVPHRGALAAPARPRGHPPGDRSAWPRTRAGEERWNAPEVEAGMDALIQIVTRVRAPAHRDRHAAQGQGRPLPGRPGRAGVGRFLAEQGRCSPLPRPSGDDRHRAGTGGLAPRRGGRGRAWRWRSRPGAPGDDGGGAPAARQGAGEAGDRDRPAPRSGSPTSSSWPRRRRTWSRTAGLPWPQMQERQA